MPAFKAISNILYATRTK